MSIENWSDRIVLVELENEPQFSEEMQNLRDQLDAHPRDVVINLASVTLVNSSNIAQLLRARKQCVQADRKLRLAAVDDAVWTVLSVMGLDKVFEFAQDVPTALAGLQMNET